VSRRALLLQRPECAVISYQFLALQADTLRRLVPAYPGLSPPVPACRSLSQPVAACVGLCPLSGAARWAFGLGPRTAPGPVLRAPSNLRLSWPHCLTARDLHTYTPAAFENRAQNRGLGRLMLMQAFFPSGSMLACAAARWSILNSSPPAHRDSE
jgi:hypothetical protein